MLIKCFMVPNHHFWQMHTMWFSLGAWPVYKKVACWDGLGWNGDNQGWVGTSCYNQIACM